MLRLLTFTYENDFAILLTVYIKTLLINFKNLILYYEIIFDITYFVNIC